MVPLRVGTGYDVHRLVSGRKLILGGVDITYPLGLDGHSDADVLVHAVIDALLGALALGDIGKLFPDTDISYKDINSLVLLKRVRERVEKCGYLIANIDATIIAERPKLKSYTLEMRENIASVLGLKIDQVSVKATTEEGLGFTGRGEAIASQAVTLLIYQEKNDWNNNSD